MNNPHKRLREVLAEIEDANGENSAQWALVRVYDMWFDQICSHPEFETITRTEEESGKYEWVGSTTFCTRCRRSIPKGPAWR